MKCSLAVVFKLVVVFFYLFTHLARAEGPVWKVTDGSNHLFIGGTIHLLGKQDYPLPAVFNKGYRGSQILVFEIDPDEASSPAAQQKFAQHARYDDGRTLSSVLSKKTYTELNNYLAARGIPIASFEQIKPSMLSVVLTVLELQRLGIAGMGVDEFFNQRAKDDSKQRLFLESLDDQFKALLTQDEGKEDQVITQALKELNKLSTVMQATKAAWREGDNQALMEVALNPWMKEFPKVYQSLLVDRNRRWLPQLKAMMQTAEVEYVLVGALHLVGPDGLLSLMQQQGYRVEKL